MRAPPPPRALVPVLAAAAGVVVAHAVDYLLLFPQATSRDSHLAVTGHGYWPIAVGVALVAAAAAMVLAAAQGAGGRASRAAVRPTGLLSLVAWQALAFTVLEAGERSMAGVPASVLLHSPEFWFGLLLQVPVALLSLRLLSAVERAADRIATALAACAPPPRRRAALPAPRPVVLPASTCPSRPVGARAPPVALAA